jgi:hypothetical protein
LKILKLGTIVNSLEELITSDEIMLAWTMAKILGRVLLIAHWFACFYFLIGDYESYTNVFRPWPVKPHQNYFDFDGIQE